MFGKILGFIWLGVVGIVILSVAVEWFTAKKVLKKNDYYGKYIVNREYFKGEQADWQYNSFRFEITEQDSIIFYVTKGNRILQTYFGTITTTTPYASERLILNMQQPTHHIVTSNPTTYRNWRNFNLVFYSPKFNNVYFKKGEWVPISPEEK